MTSIRLALAATLGIAAAVTSTETVRAAEPTPNFTVVVTFSKETLAKLTGMKEQVTVSAMYSGMPTKEAEKKKIPDEIGEVGLGNEEQSRPLSGPRETFAFAGKAFQAARTKWVQPGSASLLINVYSSRKVSDDNLLDCGIFQDTLAVANAKPIEITCKLIGE